MPNSRNKRNYIDITDAVIDGRLSASDAGSGTPSSVRTMFEVAERLGRLSRGNSVEFTPRQAGLLYEIIENGVDLTFSGKAPTRTHELIALRLMDTAFEVDDPMGWAFTLMFVCNGQVPRVVSPRPKAPLN